MRQAPTLGAAIHDTEQEHVDALDRSWRDLNRARRRLQRLGSVEEITAIDAALQAVAATHDRELRWAQHPANPRKKP